MRAADRDVRLLDVTLRTSRLTLAHVLRYAHRGDAGQPVICRPRPHRALIYVPLRLSLRHGSVATVTIVATCAVVPAAGGGVLDDWAAWELPRLLRQQVPLPPMMTWNVR